jgi:hypothetical protein
MKWLWDAEGLIVAAFLFLLRYSLLFKDNEMAGVRMARSTWTWSVSFPRSTTST